MGVGLGLGEVEDVSFLLDYNSVKVGCFVML